MKALIKDGGSYSEIRSMSFQQNKQAIAIADCIGRLIPQEGVDYEVEVIFSGRNNPSVSMNIVPLTDKGEWWKKYVISMIGKYPPTIENPPQSIVEDVESVEQGLRDIEEGR